MKNKFLLLALFATTTIQSVFAATAIKEEDYIKLPFDVIARVTVTPCLKPFKNYTFDTLDAIILSSQISNQSFSSRKKLELPLEMQVSGLSTHGVQLSANETALNLKHTLYIQENSDGIIVPSDSFLYFRNTAQINTKNISNNFTSVISVKCSQVTQFVYRNMDISFHGAPYSVEVQVKRKVNN